jgi:hypothetical protein
VAHKARKEKIKERVPVVPRMIKTEDLALRADLRVVHKADHKVVLRVVHRVVEWADHKVEAKKDLKV